MLLRNIDQQSDLCNGTRLRITKIYKRVIEAEIISGGNIGVRTGLTPKRLRMTCSTCGIRERERPKHTRRTQSVIL